MKHDKLTVFLLVFSVVYLLMMPFAALREDMGIYDGVIRLHVLADSDEPEAQRLKLKVRDGIRGIMDDMLDGTEDIESANAALEAGKEKIRLEAEKILRENGSELPVDVTLTYESYPTRAYGCVTLPAGTYRSLRVLIGSAEGKNWWCILFPELCTGAAGCEKEELVEAGLTPSQIRLITGDSTEVRVRFRLLEMISGLFSK